MMTIKKTEKQQYLAPAIAVFDIVENTYLLAASPNARPGGMEILQEVLLLNLQNTKMEAIAITLKDKH